MREAEKAILKNVAIRVGNHSANLPNTPITGFMAMVGKSYRQELMIIGRAVNGWTKKKWFPCDLKNELNIEQFVEGVFDSVTKGNPCPMKWVSDSWGNDDDYNTRRSAFWRCVRRTVGALEISNIDKPEWPSHLVWSNIYKVAPGDGGNPRLLVQSIQFDECKALIREEIRSFVPKRILFMTGMDWAEPFLESCQIHVPSSSTGNYVKGSTTIKLNDGTESQVIVAVHPQGKKESVWVEEVVNEFKKH